MVAVHNLGDTPGHTKHDEHCGMKEAVHGRRARGGRAARETDSSLSDTHSHDKMHKANEYNAVGSPQMHEAADEVPGFKKGGRKRAYRGGGTAHGHMEHHRMDRHARRAKGGAARSPYSTGSELSAPTDDREGRGHEGIGPA